MSERLELGRRIPMSAADTALWNAVLARFAEAHPVSDTLALRIRPSDLAWSSPEVDRMTIAGAAVAYEWLSLPPDLPQGLQLPAERLAALPQAVRPLMSAMMLERAARAWPSLRPVHAGVAAAPDATSALRLLLEFFRDGAPSGALLVGLARSDAAALARAAGFDSPAALAPDPTLPVEILPRIASVTVRASEAAALAPGDVVMLGRLTEPFDALRIGPNLHAVRRTEDGGLTLDVAP